MGDEAGAPEPELVRFESIDISPNQCPLTAPLDVDVQFEALDHYPNAFWEITVRTLPCAVLRIGRCNEECAGCRAS